jgi:chromosome segregation ATPase
LLGGSVKKELEKSAQALDEANMDLERKIKENEKLHDELTDRQFEFTDSINKLLKQIQDLEKLVQDLQDENANLLSLKDTATNPVVHEVKAVDQEEQERFLKEIEALKSELKK